MGRGPRTFSDEFQGASEADIRAARPDVTELGARHSTAWIFLGLLLAALALAGAVLYVYQDEALRLYEEMTGEPLLGLSSEEEAAIEAALEATSSGPDDGSEGAETETGDAETAAEPEPPEPRAMTPGEPTISGKLSKSAAEKQLAGLAPNLQKCLDEVRGRAPEFSGTLEVSLTIKRTGATSGYKATASGASDKSFEACVKKQYTRGKWPRPAGKRSASITQTLEF